MADREDRMQPEGGPPNGRPRRQPPIIEGEAIEISDNGSPAGAHRSRMRYLLSGLMAALRSWKLAAAVAAGVLAAVIAGATGVYLASDGGGTPPQKATGVEPAPSGDVAVRGTGVAGPETAARMPLAPPDRAADKTTAEVKELENRLAAMDTALTAINERIAALDRTVRESVVASRAAAERADKVAHQFDEAKKSGDEQEAAQQLDRGALDDLASRIKAIESRQMTIRQIQERLDRLASTAGSPDKTVRIAVAAAALRNAVERDRPFTVELAAAKTLGFEEGVLAALEPFAATGLPRRNDLFRELSALLPELRRLSAPPGQDLGYLDRLQASASRMLNIRPVKDEPGDDPPAVLSRVEVRMVQQDIDAIIAELDKLPAQAKELARPWRTRAQARRDALEAARLVATASLAKLGEPVTSGSSQQ